MCKRSREKVKKATGENDNRVAVQGILIPKNKQTNE